MYIPWSRVLEIVNNTALPMLPIGRVEILYSGEVTSLRRVEPVESLNRIGVTEIYKKDVSRNFRVLIPSNCSKDEFFKILGEAHQLILTEIGPFGPRELETNFKFRLIDIYGDDID